MIEKPFGHTATVEVKQVVGTLPYQTPRVEFVKRQIHRRGPRRVVERAARLLRCFVRVLSVEAHTREQYIAAYGNGTEHGPYPCSRGVRRRDPLS